MMKNINPYSASYLLHTKYQSLYELFINFLKNVLDMFTAAS